MSNKDEICRIFKEEEKELRTWVMSGFIGGHHWKQGNYFQIIMYPLLMVIFLISSVMFGIELVDNIMNMSSGGISIESLQNNEDLIGSDVIWSVIPSVLGLIALTSIILNVSWWVYDLKQIQNKFQKQKNIFCKFKTENKLKSVFITYLLCMTVGTLGVHRFYLNRPISGVLMLMLSLSSFLGITGLILLIWFFYDSLNIYKEVLKDNKEIYLKELENK